MYVLPNPFTAPPYRVTQPEHAKKASLYPDNDLIEMIEYLLPVDKADVDAARKTLQDNPNYLLFVSGNNVYESARRAPTREIAVSNNPNIKLKNAKNFEKKRKKIYTEELSFNKLING